MSNKYRIGNVNLFRSALDVVGKAKELKYSILEERKSFYNEELNPILFNLESANHYIQEAIKFVKEEEFIRKICERANQLLNVFYRDVIKIIEFYHYDTCQLKLEELLNSDDTAFEHDIKGLMAHFNSEIEEFTPRYAA